MPFCLLFAIYSVILLKQQLQYYRRRYILHTPNLALFGKLVCKYQFRFVAPLVERLHTAALNALRKLFNVVWYVFAVHNNYTYWLCSQISLVFRDSDLVCGSFFIQVGWLFNLAVSNSVWFWSIWMSQPYDATVKFTMTS